MKQVIVMRTDLNMRKGKMIVQGAHASMMFLIPSFGRQPFTRPEDKTAERLAKLRHQGDCLAQWLATGTKKICVRADSEEQLLGLHKAATEAGLQAHLVTDAGKTEFNGVPTVTCLAIGPNEDEAVDKITESLTLL